MRFFNNGKIKPVIYKEKYVGLESIPRAMEGPKARKTWGRVTVTIDGQGDIESKAKPYKALTWLDKCNTREISFDVVPCQG